MSAPERRGGERSLGEALAGIEYFGEHACLRAIAIAANRQDWSKLDQTLTEEQVAEALLKVWPEFKDYRSTEVSAEAQVAYARPYCSVANCHFSTEIIGVEMPGEVGLCLHFPTVKSMDDTPLPCKLQVESLKTR